MGEGFVVNDYANYPTIYRSRRRRKSTVPAWLSLSCFLAICLLLAGMSSHAIAYSLRSWYPYLAKGKINPPGWIFMPVWIILYAGMAVPAWMVWRTARRAPRTDAMVIFGLQLFLSFLWIFFFFHAHRLLVSTVIGLLLWMAVVAMIALFGRVRILAGAVLAPYLGWITFVIALNLVLLQKN
jgi:tryptophan-rich sensory protein